MKSVFERIVEKSKEFEGRPMFTYLRDAGIDPRRRLQFVPYLTHFVMTFADLYRFVLPENPPRDRYQELVNIHLSEEDTHWKWFLTDLGTLDLDAETPFTNVMRLIWGDETLESRMLAYHMCRLGFGAESLRKLVLVHAIESTGRVALESLVTAGRDVVPEGKRKLVYFGSHHLETETGHTLETDVIHQTLRDIALDEATRRDLIALVDEVFFHFTAFADEAHRFAQLSDAAYPHQRPATKQPTAAVSS
jgi:hypothetical protein